MDPGRPPARSVGQTHEVGRRSRAEAAKQRFGTPDFGDEALRPRLVETDVRPAVPENGVAAPDDRPDERRFAACPLAGEKERGRRTIACEKIQDAGRRGGGRSVVERKRNTVDAMRQAPKRRQPLTPGYVVPDFAHRLCSTRGWLARNIMICCGGGKRRNADERNLIFCFWSRVPSFHNIVLPALATLAAPCCTRPFVRESRGWHRSRRCGHCSRPGAPSSGERQASVSSARGSSAKLSIRRSGSSASSGTRA